MKTYILLLVFLLSPVVMESQGVKTENGWVLNPNTSMVIDSDKTGLKVENGVGVFSNCGKPTDGRNYIQFDWSKSVVAKTPDTILASMKLKASPSITGFSVIITISNDSSGRYVWYKKQVLFQNWSGILYFNLKNYKEFIPYFDKISISYQLITKDSITSADVILDDLLGRDVLDGVTIYDSFDKTTGVPQEKPDKVIVPNEFVLYQNYPNPFNPSTTIKFSVPNRGPVRLIVFNSLGQEISTLVNEEKETGNHEVRFNASDLSSGVYFYRLQTVAGVETKKMVLKK